VKLNAPRALARSFLKDAYHFSRSLLQFLQVDMAPGAIVDHSLHVENPARVRLEPGVSVGRDVSLICSAAGSIILREGATLMRGVTLAVEGTGVIEIGRHVSVGPGVRMKTASRVVIGEHSHVMEHSSIEPREENASGVLETGARVTIHAYNYLDTTGPIRIGADTHTGPFSLFYTHNHCYDKPGSIWDQGIRVEGITLGEGIWMGSKSMIMPGAVVGDGTVIAAGSIVTKQFGRDEVLLGSPARSLRKRHGS
jgi:acetyltransferase-like isoleucine patch superfamily enzyme